MRPGHGKSIFDPFRATDLECQSPRASSPFVALMERALLPNGDTVMAVDVSTTPD
jgi:hypothetical protein